MACALGVVLLVAVQGIVLGAYRAAAVIENRSAADARRELPFGLLAADLTSMPAGGGLTLEDDVLALRTMNAIQGSRVAPRHVVSVRYPAGAGDR